MLAASSRGLWPALKRHVSISSAAERSLHANAPVRQQGDGNGAARATVTRDRYPASLNIFHAGSWLTAYIGTVKLTGASAFIYGYLSNASLLQEATSDTFLSATTGYSFLALAIWAAPWFIIHNMTSPFVASINIYLPPEARRTQPDLMKFASNPPPNTILEFTTLRFFPLPKRRSAKLADLRTLPGKAGRIANLEYLPPKLRDQSGPQGPSLFRALLGGRRRFSVRPGERYTKTTRGPGVWEEMFEAVRRQSGEAQAIIPAKAAPASRPLPSPMRRKPIVRLDRKKQ